MSPTPTPEQRATKRLEAADIDGLIPTFASTWADVDLAEQANIEAAARWAFGGRRVASASKLLTVEFADRIHRRMFDGVWQWAGRHRSVPAAHGADPGDIEAAMTALFVDARSRLDRDVGSPRTRALRLHDALIDVCAYRCGNRRHARFMADLSLHIAGSPRIDWSLVRQDEAADPTTAAGLSALQKALDDASRPSRLEASLDRATRPRK